MPPGLGAGGCCLSVTSRPELAAGGVRSDDHVDRRRHDGAVPDQGRTGPRAAAAAGRHQPDHRRQRPIPSHNGGEDGCPDPDRLVLNGPAVVAISSVAGSGGQSLVYDGPNRVLRRLAAGANVTVDGTTDPTQLIVSAAAADLATAGTVGCPRTC